MLSSPLHEAPIAIDARLKWMIHLAWAMPPLTIAAGTAYGIIRAPVGTSPSVVLKGIACVGWLVLASVPVWRGLLLDIGRLVLARANFVPLLLLTCAVLLLGASSPADSLWKGAGASLVCFTVAAAYLEWQGNRRQLLFTLVLLAVNVLLLIPLDRFVGAVVLPMRTHNNVFIEHDSLLGWKLRRGVALTRRDKLYASTETINDLGFRTPRLPVAKPAGVKRILFLGDSHTESYTVNDDETYTVLLEASLTGNRPIEAISLGVGGYSTDQEVLAYLHVGRLYRPDLVVLQFCSNDVLYNVLDHYWRGKKPRFARYGDFLLLSGVPVPNLHDSGLFGPALLQHSSIILFLETILRQLAVKRSVEQEADPAEAWRVTALLIRDLDRIVQSDGARLVVFQADRNPESEAKLRAILGPLSIPYLETAQAYTDPFESYWVAGHWNQKGHRAIAKVLDPELRPYLQ